MGFVAPTWWDLYKHSLSLSWPFSRVGLVRMLTPMDIARYFEIPAVARALELRGDERILDLSSPKLLAVYLANKLRVEVVATDIWRQEIESWQRLVAAKKKEKNLVWGVADGRELLYEDETFDRVYSISVLEHIPGKGDSRAVAELARVLKPGGRLVITVPVADKTRREYKSQGIYGEEGQGRVFWARRYSRKALYRRLIKPSGLRVIWQEYCYERIPFFSIWHARLLPWSVLLGLTYPLLAKLSLKKTHKLPKDAYLANTILVLEKPKKS